MRIAVPYENGNIFQHFGRSEAFKFYDVADGAVTAAAVVSTNGSGHGALAGFLVANHADVVICGGIGGGAQSALTEAGIRFYGGVSGSADAAVQALLDGSLGYDPEARCDHHDHAHGAGHTCGEHGCGEHSCHSWRQRQKSKGSGKPEPLLVLRRRKFPVFPVSVLTFRAGCATFLLTRW